jgi:hypothetical protein
MPGNAQIGNLAVNLSLETAAFQTGAAKARAQATGLKGSLSSLGESMKGFAGGLVSGLGIGLLTTGLASVASNALEMGSALSESAQKAGVSVEALQELNLAATQSGISQETLASSMAKLNRSLGDLENGKKAAVAAFAAIGLSAEDLKGKTPDQALRVIADALNKLPDVQQRVAIGSQIMGRGFSELLPLINGGSKALDDYAKKSKDQGEITTEEAQRLDDLADSWDRVKIRSGVAAARIIAMFAELTDKMDAFTNNWFAKRDAFVASMENMATRSVAYVNSMITGITTAITGRLNAVWEGAKEKINAVTEAFRTMWDKVVGHSYVPDMVEGIGESFGQLQGLMVNPAVQAALNVSEAFRNLEVEALGRFGDAIADVITGARSMKDAFSDLARSIISDLIRMTVKMLIFRAVSAIIGGPSANIGASLGSMEGAGAFSAALPGLASGGTIGGFGGVDNNLLSVNGSPIARVSRGEQFSISPANDRAPQRVIVELRDDMLDARIADGADVQIVRRYPAMKADTMRSIGERQRRA